MSTSREPLWNGPVVWDRLKTGAVALELGMGRPAHCLLGAWNLTNDQKDVSRSQWVPSLPGTLW